MSIANTVNEDVNEHVVIDSDGLDALIATLRAEGYAVVGPTLGDGAIVLDELESAADLPKGWTAELEAGSYRLQRRRDEARFGYQVGPHSFKKYVHPPRVRLWQVRRAPRDGELSFKPRAAERPRYAFLGVRACDLAALKVQDRVMLGQREAQDPIYGERRIGAFIITVNCTEAGSTCFCVSTDTGPAAADGFDLSLTELPLADDASPDAPHDYLLNAGSERGRALLRALPSRPAEAPDHARARAGHERAVSQMGRTLDTRGVRELLRDNPESPRWDHVAASCLSCGNCTMVCPTCFCTTVEDTVDLTGEHAERWRSWDSCFNSDFSYIHGGAVRPSTRARYRQWLTHKFSTWFDQFDTSGCVGCGRCIAWCPVQIDVTAEVSQIRKIADAEAALADAERGADSQSTSDPGSRT